MSVIVDGLTKIYGTQKAVNNVSFEAKKGEILGFLGPNGAGKTTTMKMLTCFISPTSGEATVAGHSITTDPLTVRDHIGYLPEHNPLYKDMYIKEYLNFVAGLYKIKKRKHRVEEMIALTGLEKEQHKQIGQLSKGYRQRVGLAQAMINDPDVLILDEPTSGLDPNQLAEIRALIQNIGQEKTVIFSSHIMQEVQALCDRVLIIDSGNIVANDHIDDLQNRIKGDLAITVEFEQQVSAQQLDAIDGVLAVSSLGHNRWRLTATKGKKDARATVYEYAVKNNLTLLEMHKDDVSIEDIFRKLTS